MVVVEDHRRFISVKIKYSLVMMTGSVYSGWRLLALGIVLKTYIYGGNYNLVEWYPLYTTEH